MAPKVVIQLVEELKDVMPVGEVCRHLGVGCSSYYRWRKNAEQITQKEARDQQIGELCKQHISMKVYCTGNRWWIIDG